MRFQKVLKRRSSDPGRRACTRKQMGPDFSVLSQVLTRWRDVDARLIVQENQRGNGCCHSGCSVA
ncbi:hypothetical protein XFF6992_440045 [Xanthomonas citri pv. fuscans]|nr:hypothetical protein XFF6992_440045 [Xanthomonas citri pv. fuscans]SOO34622.1 hypothetical protein XFF6994_4320002 [Xanthomonas citri pv. fuscans]